MFDAALWAIRGNVVADPRVGGAGDNPDRVTFRVVSNRRERDPQTGEWKQVGEYGMNVVCWRRLARGVAAGVHRGDPVLVRGRITERRYTGADGEQHYRTEVTADFVGHDLSQGVAARFSRFTAMDRAADGGSGDEAAPRGAGTAVTDDGEFDGDASSGQDSGFDSAAAADFDRQPVAAA